MASTQGDGLSFAESGPMTELFNSDIFTTCTREDVTRDCLNLIGGSVLVGQSVTINFVITDNSVNDPFWLLQTANMNDAPEPASLALVALALGALGWSRRKG